MCTIISQERFKYSVHNPQRREAVQCQRSPLPPPLSLPHLLSPALFLILHLYIFIYIFIYIRLRFNYKVRYVSGSPGIVLHTISRDWRVRDAADERVCASLLRRLPLSSRACPPRARGSVRFFVALLPRFLCVRFP